MTDQQDYIYQLRPVRTGMLADGPTEAEARILEEHFAYLQDLAGTGIVRLAGRTLTNGPETFGIVVFRAATPEEAHWIMMHDPAVRDGVMTAELSPFRVALVGKR
jgi:uncharacterized protein YciI